MTLIERIQGLVADGQTEKSIEELLAYIKENESNLLDRIILLKSRMHDLNEKIIGDTIGLDDAAKQRARINESVLKILHEITPSYLAPKVVKKTSAQSVFRPTPAHQKSNQRGLIIGLAAAVIILIISGIYFFQTTNRKPEVNLGHTRFENIYRNNQWQLKIWQPGRVKYAKGKTGCVVVEFTLGGMPIVPKFNEDKSRVSLAGYLIASTGYFEIPSNDYDLSRDTMIVPFSSFNVPYTGVDTPYEIQLKAFMLVDGTPSRYTSPQSFVINY